MSIVSLIGDFSYVAITTAGGAALGALGTPWICKKFQDKSKPTDGMEAIPQFMLGGIAGCVAGFAFGIASVREDNNKSMPSNTEIIIIDSENTQCPEGQNLIVDPNGQILGCTLP